MINAIPRQIMALLLVLLLVMALPAGALAAGGEGDTLALNTPDESGNIPFSVGNMFPGDAEVKDFTVRVDHKEPLTLYYHADIRPGSEKLAEVMMVKIQLPHKGLTLYDGLMRDMPSALEHPLAADEKAVHYRITAYLDTSVGNDYQNRKLTADFRWWYAEETGGGPEEPDPVSVKLAAEVLVDGAYPRGSAFTFVLKDEHGNVRQSVNNRDGLIEFGTLTFAEEGVYRYTLTQKPGTDEKMEYDEAVYTVIITVIRGPEGYTASVTYEKDGQPYQLLPRFANRTKGTELPEDPDIPEDPDNPKTGDDSPIELYLALFAGSTGAMLLLLLLIRRKKEEEAQ